MGITYCEESEWGVFSQYSKSNGFSSVLVFHVSSSFEDKIVTPELLSQS